MNSLIKKLPQLATALGALMLAGTVAAQTAAVATTAATPPVPTINSGDTAWVLVSTALVLLMTPGLAFFYAGMVRSKNAVGMLMQNFIALAVVSVVWVVAGYSLAFGPTAGGFIGNLQWAFLNGVGNQPYADYSATVPHSMFMAFQCMFAVITPALITGAFAERMKFKTYLAFLVLWSLLIYSPVCHWVWNVGGFLHAKGMLDFAGGSVVHMTAGFSALAAAMAFGPRKDYGKADTSPHNVPFICLGTALLWFGWFGFNSGSALAANDIGANAFVTTHIATAVATVTWMVIDWFVKGKPSLTGACVGAVVGLIAITPACGFVSAQSAIWIGLIAATCSNFVAIARSKTKVDDSLDVFAAHGVAGLVGLLLTGIFATKVVNAGGAEGSMAQLGTQAFGAVIVAVYSFGVTFVLCKVLNAVFGLRPTTQDEEAGLDKSEHGERAYVN